MIVEKIIFDIREGIRQFTDDSEISDSHILYLYGLKRSKYLRQEANNLQRNVDNSILQTLCLEVEEVNISECGIDYECGTIMRTVKPIPKPLELHLRSAITSIKPNNRISVPFNFVNKDRAIYSKYSKYNKSIYTFLDNDLYLYFISQSNAIKLLDCVTVTGIFEDPLELKNYKNCCGCNDAQICFDIMKTDYPLQSHNIDYIREEIIQNYIRTLQIPEDKQNNSDDN